MRARDHTIKAALGSVLVLGAIAPASVSPRFDQNPVYLPAPARTAVRVVRVSDGGPFDWGDAGIGAAGGIGLSTLVIAVARWRQRMPRGAG